MSDKPPTPADSDDRTISELGGQGLASDGSGSGISSADENVSLTEDQIRRASGVPNLAIHTYGDLENMRSWDDVFASCPARAAAVLFETVSKIEGHWLAVFDGPDGAHVFDPVGVALDAERSYIPPGRLQALGESQPAFARLLSTQQRPVHVNKTHFQEDKPGINTCGRWTSLRLRERDRSDPEFAQAVLQAARQAQMPPDAWVCTAVPVS